MRRTSIAKGTPWPVRAETKADLLELRPMENWTRRDASGRVQEERLRSPHHEHGLTWK